MDTTFRLLPALLIGSMVLSGAAPARAGTLPAKPYASLFLVAPEPMPSRSEQDTAPLRSAVLDVRAHTPNVIAPPSKSRRVLVPAMYAGLVTLQTLDTHSTLKAVDAGLSETNPVMRWATGHPVAFVSMKAAATTATILMAEKIRKKHPKRAVVFLAAINATYALIVTHNYRAVSSAR